MILQSFAPDPSSLRPRRSLPRQQMLPLREHAVAQARNPQESVHLFGELAGVVLIFLVFLTLAALL